jgi:hypothetical protein
MTLSEMRSLMLRNEWAWRKDYTQQMTTKTYVRKTEVYHRRLRPVRFNDNLSAVRGSGVIRRRR